MGNSGNRVLRLGIGSAGLLVVALANVGCSADEVYQEMQSQRERSCEVLTGDEREDCLAKARDTNSDYDKITREGQRSS